MTAAFFNCSACKKKRDYMDNLNNITGKTYFFYKEAGSFSFLLSNLFQLNSLGKFFAKSQVRLLSSE